MLLVPGSHFENHQLSISQPLLYVRFTWGSTAANDIRCSVCEARTPRIQKRRKYFAVISRVNRETDQIFYLVALIAEHVHNHFMETVLFPKLTEIWDGHIASKYFNTLTPRVKQRLNHQSDISLKMIPSWVPLSCTSYETSGYASSPLPARLLLCIQTDLIT